MFRKRTPRGALRHRAKNEEEGVTETTQVVVKKEEEEEEERQPPVSDSEIGALQARIRYVQEYHRLRQRSRGLQAADTGLEAEKDFISPGEARAHALLDKSFQPQVVRNDEAVDIHL